MHNTPQYAATAPEAVGETCHQQHVGTGTRSRVWCKRKPSLVELALLHGEDHPQRILQQAAANHTT